MHHDRSARFLVASGVSLAAVSFILAVALLTIEIN